MSAVSTRHASAKGRRPRSLPSRYRVVFSSRLCVRDATFAIRTVSTLMPPSRLFTRGFSAWLALIALKHPVLARQRRHLAKWRQRSSLGSGTCDVGYMAISALPSSPMLLRRTTMARPFVCCVRRVFRGVVVSIIPAIFLVGYGFSSFLFLVGYACAPWPCDRMTYRETSLWAPFYRSHISGPCRLRRMGGFRPISRVPLRCNVALFSTRTLWGRFVNWGGDNFATMNRRRNAPSLRISHPFAPTEVLRDASAQHGTLRALDEYLRARVDASRPTGYAAYHF